MKKIAFVNSFLPAVIAAGITLASSEITPANAYSVGLNGRRAGNPVGDLYDVSLKGGSVSEGGDVGRTLDPVKWFVPANGTNPSVNLSAEAVITVNNLTSNRLSLAIKLTNTTAANFQAAITSFGFGVSPNADSVKLDQQGREPVIFDRAKLGSNFPGGFKQIDICVFAANNCSGGDIKEGLKSGGNFDTFRLDITGKFGLTDKTAFVTLHDFPLKFQTQDSSYEPAGVPEPITIVGSGLALGFGALFKREAAKKRSRAKIKS